MSRCARRPAAIANSRHPWLASCHLHVFVTEAESMATVYPAARNLCAAVTYTSSGNCSLPNRAAHPHDDTKKEEEEEEEESTLFALGRIIGQVYERGGREAKAAAAVPYKSMRAAVWCRGL